ncbi:MAG: hypothetical protein ACLRIL_07185 [Fusicatenibacter saccharivorans]
MAFTVSAQHPPARPGILLQPMPVMGSNDQPPVFSVDLMAMFSCAHRRTVKQVSGDASAARPDQEVDENADRQIHVSSV